MRIKLFTLLATIVLSICAVLCDGIWAVRAQQPAAVSYESAVTRAREECASLWSDRAFDQLRDKVPLGEEEPTPSMLANPERMRPTDKPLADLAIKTLESCRAAYAPAFTMLPPSVADVIHGLQRKQDVLIAELYSGKITFGEFNTKMKALNVESLRALSMIPQSSQSDHPYIATSLNNLAVLHVSQGRYADAEPLYKQSLAIYEKTFGPDHPNVATALNNLARLYQDQGRYTDAEPLYKRSLAIREKALGPDHPDVAVSLNNLARLYQHQGR
jgi:tetratricopeptide (TPR) repeat protein